MRIEVCFRENRVLFFLPRQQTVKCLRENSKVFAGKQLADWVYSVSELGVPDRRIVCTRLGDWQQPINPMFSQNRILVKVKLDFTQSKIGFYETTPRGSV